jgi:glycosyltransferase involved in cell wall biosynthesis
MRICFVEDTELKGGTQLWVFDAIQFFSSRDHEIYLITPDSSYLADTLRKSKLNINLVTYDYRGIEKPSLHDEKSWILALSNSDVAICTVHPPRNDFHCSVFVAHCIDKAKLNTILITKTGTIVPEYKRIFYFPDEKVKTRIIAIAEFTYRYLIDHYDIPSHMVRLIYQGIDLSRFSSKSLIKEVDEKVNINKNKFPILACIGYLDERKGQSNAIRALERVIGFYPKCHLLIVGDGPDKGKLEKLVYELELGKRVTFIPFTDEPEKVIEGIDILLLPSLFKEGLPNVILEALAMGIPVIASDIGGISEIVKSNENGFLVPVGDLNRIVSAIQKISENPEFYQFLSKNANRLITEKFNRRNQFNYFEKYFNEILTDNKI